MLLGREHELAMILGEAELARSGAGRSVHIAGPPGIGKTTLLDEAEQRLAASGFRVLRHTSTQPERLLSWAAIVAMVGRIGTASVETLPTGSARSLAMVTDPDPDVDIHPHGVALAFADLILAVARQGPVAVLVDDSQWLDPASAAALTFACRSWSDAPVVLIVTRRSDDPPTIHAPAEFPCASIDLAPLTVDQIAELARAFGARLSLTDQQLLFERSGGNPLIARRIAADIASGMAIEQALSSRSFSDSLGSQLGALPLPTLRCLEFAALLDRPTLAELAAAAAVSSAGVLDLLDAAERAGLVTIDGDSVDFVHPLIADAVTDQMSTAARRSAHARLAGLALDVERRGTHLAESMPAPSASVAAQIEAAAQLASRRGAFDRAVRLFQACLAATPSAATPPADTADTRQRLVALATAQSNAAQYPDVLATIARLDPAARSAVAAAVLPAGVRATGELLGLETVCALLDDAVTWVDDADILGRMYASRTTARRQKNLFLGLTAAEESLAAARAHDDREWIVGATCAVAACRAAVGQQVDVDGLLALDYSFAGDYWTAYATSELQQMLWFTGDNRGVPWSAHSIETASVDLPLPRRWNQWMQHSKICVGRGDWNEAEAALRQTLRYNEQDGSECVDLAYVLATTGRPDAARAALALVESAERARGRTAVFQSVARRGMLAWTWREDGAADQLVVAEEIGAEIGLGAVRAIPYRRDLVEALVAATRLDEADAAAARLRADAERCQSPSAAADAAAAEAVVASGRGDHAAATERIELACKLHEGDGLVYEKARSLLAAGRIARRAGRRADARRHLQAAETLFTAMSATPWVQRCSEELARLGGRAPGTNALTSSELQVAQLAAGGRTNAEIATELCVSLRTVEAHLSRTYRKLGIRSRTGLAPALAHASSGA